jgi:GTP cyclohydrolase II
MPTAFGEFQMHVYLDAAGTEHAVLVRGVVLGRQGVPVRLHSECLTGDVFGSCRCDCGEQLKNALAYIAEAECGVIIYMRGHEGRGIGLANKIRAYALQQAGRDTVQANTDLGLPVESRDFSAAAGILHELQVESAALITNNPDKLVALAGCGVQLTRRIALRSTVTPHNGAYLRTKRDTLQHSIVFG